MDQSIFIIKRASGLYVDGKSSLYGLMSYAKNMHYVNMPMQYAAIFTAVKTDNFQMTYFLIFLLKT